MNRLLSNFTLIVLLFATIGAAPSVRAADSYLTGTMTNITSSPSGLMLMLDTGVPTNCVGTPIGWLLVRESNKTMIASALLAWHSGNRNVTVYTDNVVPGNFCVINQFDPN